MLFDATNNSRAAPATGAFRKEDGDYISMMFGDHPCNNLRTTKREHSISKQTRRARRKGLAEFATKAANGPA